MVRIKYSLISILMFLGVLCGSASQAATLGFNGAYDYATWTSSLTVDGPVGLAYSEIDPSQQTVTLYEPYGCIFGSSFCLSQEFLFSHTVVDSGLISFNWSFDLQGSDEHGAGLEFYVNDTMFNLIGGIPGVPDGNAPLGGAASGFFSTSVIAGDIIKFSLFTEDSMGGAMSSVTNFNVSTSVPEPAPLALFGIGLAALACLRRKRAG
jgi:hypothetical protein